MEKAKRPAQDHIRTGHRHRGEALNGFSSCEGGPLRPPTLAALSARALYFSLARRGSEGRHRGGASPGQTCDERRKRLKGAVPDLRED